MNRVALEWTTQVARWSDQAGRPVSQRALSVHCHRRRRRPEVLMHDGAFTSNLATHTHAPGLINSCCSGSRDRSVRSERCG